MPAFTATMSKFVFDGKAFGKAFSKAIDAIFKQAGKKFLQAALPLIPIRTGFVAGAFGVLADALGGVGGKSQIQADVGRLKGLEKKLNRVSAKIEELKAEAEAHASRNFAPSPTVARELSRYTKQYNRIAKDVHKIVNKRSGDVIFGIAAKAEELTRHTPRDRPEKQGLAGHPTRRETKTSRNPIAGKTGETPTSKERVPTPRYEFYRPPGGGRILKTLRSGRQFASYSRLDEGNKREATVSLELGQTKAELQPTYQFSFRINISYFEINDEFSNRYTPSAPWKSFATGKRAFLDHMKANLSRLPSVLSYIIETELTVDVKGSVSQRTKNVVL